MVSQLEPLSRKYIEAESLKIEYALSEMSQFYEGNLESETYTEVLGYIAR